MEFPYIDPVIVDIWGPLALRWYGLTYLVGIGAAWFLGVRRAKRPGSIWTPDEISDFIFYGFLGVVVGGRVGYVLFYQFGAFLENPLYLFHVQDGGMSFHGGMLGVIAAFFWYARKQGKSFWSLADFIAPLAPIGLGAGRLGNFINGELWGRQVTDPDFPLGIRFTCNFEKAPWFTNCDQENLLRHPSQLYEFALEGVVLFVVLYWFSRQPRPRMTLSGLFLAGYGTFRFIVEYFREPDEHLKHMAEWLTMGQVLSAPMIILGVALVIMAYRKPVYDIADSNKNSKADSNVKTKQKKKKAK